MALPQDVKDREFQKFVEDGSGDVAVRTAIVVEDIEIGSVEIKNATTDDRAIVSAAGRLQVDAGASAFAIQVDDYSTSNIVYLGQANPGSLTNVAVWQIKKIDLTTGVAITWANGNSLFTNKWTDRLTIIYS